MSDSVQSHRRQPTRLPRPWDSPGKNTGVGCHFLLQCRKVKVKLLSRAQLFVTPLTTAYQAPPSMGFSRQEYWSGVPSCAHSGFRQKSGDAFPSLPHVSCVFELSLSWVHAVWVSEPSCLEKVMFLTCMRVGFSGDGR